MERKKKFKLLVGLRNIILAIVAALMIWGIFSNLMNVYEQNKYPAIGQLVEVDGKNMHVYTEGEGDHTIVLLSGLGTAAPTLDFEPLINEMAENNQVAVVEPFGYGWSDTTDKERTVENIVEEIRIALKEANIHGPYVLMPHSISGIYSMYYANNYPDEVEAIIGIDPTLPQALEYFDETPPSMPSYLRYVAPTGIARLALYLSPDNFLPIADEGTYMEENIKMTKAISAWKGYNKNVIDEVNRIKDNIETTEDMTFSPELPVMIFTIEDKNENEQAKTNITFFNEQLNNGRLNKLVTLEGHHYLHWTNYKEMNEAVNEFLKSIP